MKSLTSTSLLQSRYSRGFVVLFIAILTLSSCKNKKEVSSGDNGKPPKRLLSGKILESVTIEKVMINHTPMFGPDGERWDSWAIGQETPDLFVVLKFRDQVLYESETREDVAYGVAAELEKNLPVSLNSWNLEHVLYVYDEDGVSADDNVGFFSFIPLEFEKKDEILLSSSDAQLKVTLRVKWNYVNK
ncbi:MAG: hypothetical protein SGI87_12985 [Flavobacteriales bacterium]|nr:hypothetical protein [Flavobacteriales bacterium]